MAVRSPSNREAREEAVFMVPMIVQKVKEPCPHHGGNLAGILSGDFASALGPLDMVSDL